MAEYIERDALEGAFDAATMDFLEKEDNLFDRKSVLAGMSIAAGIVHTVPAADVAPVVHGRWIGEEGGYWHCSECGRKVYSAMFSPGLSNHTNYRRYCNCGALMDKEDK